MNNGGRELINATERTHLESVEIIKYNYPEVFLNYQRVTAHRLARTYFRWRTLNKFSRTEIHVSMAGIQQNVCIMKCKKVKN